LALFTFSQILLAQKTEISGIVRDSVSLEPIEGVVVKALADKKIIAFGSTNNLGIYKLTFESTVPILALSFQNLTYKNKTQNVNNKTQKLNVSLSSKLISLREVTVKAPMITVNKDTLSFNVASFKSASDRSIEDVIKKLPGVEVADNGTISYQGKAISSFKIEGLDMLGGKYTLATRNIQAKDVSRVEVNDHYQKIKQLQGKEYSDNVAMNLKLTKEAQMHLLGTMELGGGYHGKEGLYDEVLTAMTFNKKVQFMGTQKVNNFGSPLANEVTDHFGGNYIYNVANELIGSNLASSAPLDYSRYREKNDLLTSLNSALKLSEDKTLSINIDYNREQSKYHYETNSIYSLNNDTIEINEQQKPKYLSNSISANINYLLNSSKLYLENNTFVSMKDVDNHFDLTTNGNQIQQLKTSRLFGLNNELDFMKKLKKRKYEFNSVINYNDLPDNRLTLSGVPGITGDYYQMLQGKSFFTKEAVSFGYDVSKISRLSVDADVQMNYDRIYTQLQKNDTATLNQNDGYKIVTSVRPVYNLLSADKRYGFTIGIPVNIYNIGFKNRINSGNDFYFNRTYFNSWLRAHYIFSAFTTLDLRTGINNSLGDIGDFVVNPIQTSYQDKSAKTGILAADRSFSSSIKVEYGNPLQLFFANGSVSYNNDMRNILNSQVISTGNSTIGFGSTGISSGNTSQNGSISGRVSKNIRDISTSFSLGANYGVSYSKQMRQGVEYNVNSNSFSVTPNVHTQIVKRLEINYSMNYSQSTMNTTNLSTIYHQQTHGLNLSYNPIDAIVINGSMSYFRSEITPGNYKNMQFLDAGARYKHKKFEAELKLNNMLNIREYSYTVMSGIDRFSYNYHLNPREVVFICKFDL